LSCGGFFQFVFLGRKAASQHIPNMQCIYIYIYIYVHAIGIRTIYTVNQYQPCSIYIYIQYAYVQYILSNLLYICKLLYIYIYISIYMYICSFYLSTYKNKERDIHRRTHSARRRPRIKKLCIRCSSSYFQVCNTLFGIGLA
jgi:hypothetical protein